MFLGWNFSLIIRVIAKAWSRASIGSSPTGRCSDLDKVPWRDLTLLDKHDIPSPTRGLYGGLPWMNEDECMDCDCKR